MVRWSCGKQSPGQVSRNGNGSLYHHAATQVHDGNQTEQVENQSQYIVKAPSPSWLTRVGTGYQRVATRARQSGLLPGSWKGHMIDSAGRKVWALIQRGGQTPEQCNRIAETADAVPSGNHTGNLRKSASLDAPSKSVARQTLPILPPVS
jgi:hypothetical protein